MDYSAESSFRAHKIPASGVQCAEALQGHNQRNVSVSEFSLPAMEEREKEGSIYISREKEKERDKVRKKTTVRERERERKRERQRRDVLLENSLNKRGFPLNRSRCSGLSGQHPDSFEDRIDGQEIRQRKVEFLRVFGVWCVCVRVCMLVYA